MEQETNTQEDVQVEQKSSLHQVTPLSKYLAMALFIILPFLGGYIGYMFAPEKVMEVERVVTKEVNEKNVQQDTPSSLERKEYASSNGFSLLVPVDAITEEEPAQFSYSPITRIEGSFGNLCISSGYGCGGTGLQGWTPAPSKVLTTSDGVEMDFTVWTREGEVFMHLDSLLKPIPGGFTEDAQIHLRTTSDQLELADSVLTSITFGGVEKTGKLPNSDAGSLLSFTHPTIGYRFYYPSDWRIENHDTYIQVYNYPEPALPSKWWGEGENKIEGGFVVSKSELPDWSEYSPAEYGNKTIYTKKDGIDDGWHWTSLAWQLPSDSSKVVLFTIYGDTDNFDSMLNTFLESFIFLNFNH